MQINPVTWQFNTDDQRAIFTIGRENINKNKKYRLCQKCPLRYCLAFALLILISIGIVVAVPLAVMSSMATTTTAKMNAPTS